MSEQDQDSETPLRARTSGQTMKAAERKRVQQAFLAAFCVEANLTKACERVGVARGTIYVWKEKYPDFAALFDDASEQANDHIRGEIYRRAIDGYEEQPVISAGKVVFGQDDKPLMVRRYSDSLLTLLAKSRMPEFREKQHLEMSGSLDLNGARDSLLDKLGTLGDEGA